MFINKLINLSNVISIFHLHDHLIVQIEDASLDDNPSATIISYSGETIQHFYLKQGSNNINTTPYNNKNYAIRVKNGNNVIVQKI